MEGFPILRVPELSLLSISSFCQLPRDDTHSVVLDAARGKTKLHPLCSVSHVHTWQPQLKRLVLYGKSFSESPLRSPKIMDLLKCEYLLYAALTFSQLLLGKFCKMFSIFQKSQVTYPAENAFKSMPKVHYSWPFPLPFDPWVLSRNPYTSWWQFLTCMSLYIFPPERSSMVLNRFLSHWVLEKVKSHHFK